MIPEWLLRVIDIKQNVHLKAWNNKTGDLVLEQDFQCSGSEVANIGQDLPSSQIMAGNISCITEDCFFDQNKNGTRPKPLSTTF
jgi:hypothetical protein